MFYSPGASPGHAPLTSGNRGRRGWAGDRIFRYRARMTQSRHVLSSLLLGVVMATPAACAADNGGGSGADASTPPPADAAIDSSAPPPVDAGLPDSAGAADARAADLSCANDPPPTGAVPATITISGKVQAFQ